MGVSDMADHGVTAIFVTCTEVPMHSRVVCLRLEGEWRSCSRCYDGFRANVQERKDTFVLGLKPAVMALKNTVEQTNPPTMTSYKNNEQLNMRRVGSNYLQSGIKITQRLNINDVHNN